MHTNTTQTNCWHSRYTRWEYEEDTFGSPYKEPPKQIDFWISPQTQQTWTLPSPTQSHSSQLPTMSTLTVSLMLSRIQEELRTMKSEQAKAERDAKKAADKAAKRYSWCWEGETKKANDAAKTLASLQTKVLKSVKKENGEVGKPKNLYYQNFCKWSKGAMVSSEEDIKAVVESVHGTRHSGISYPRMSGPHQTLHGTSLPRLA